MSNLKKIEALVHKVTLLLEQETKKEPLNPEEFLSVMGTFVAFACDQLASNSSSIEELDTNQENVMGFFFDQYIHPSFEKKRQQISPDYEKAEANTQFKEPQEEVLDQIKEILLSNHTTPDEGFYLLQQLVYGLTRLCCQNVETQQDVKEIQQKAHICIQDGLEAALDVIQVERGLVSKQ